MALACRIGEEHKAVAFDVYEQTGGGVGGRLRLAIFFPAILFLRHALLLASRSEVENFTLMNLIAITASTIVRPYSQSQYSQVAR